MNDNHKHLEEARAYAKRFEESQEPEQLHEAYLSLENVSLGQEPGPGRDALRADCLRMWLRLLALLDRRLDPQFDPENTPDLLVQPPDAADGTSYPPGADPALIDDPVARAAYEQAIRDNQAKIARYGLQVRLHRLNERIMSRAEAFIREVYTPSADDLKEVGLAIAQADLTAQRKARLIALLVPGP